jgi:16S rRNA (cytosine1402-N4)-methyltransferase
MRHIPALLSEVMAALQPAAGDTIIDGTLGAGGYTRSILEIAGTRVIAIDRDPAAVAGGAELVAQSNGRLSLHHGRFSDLDAVAAAAGCPAVDGVVLDVGVSSMQIDEAERGFSFQADGPLDMRMSGEGATAADIVNGESEARLADIFFHLGGEKRSRAIARAIVADRVDAPFTSTQQLAGLVARILKTPRIDGRHAATRTFQALRIYVNDELGEVSAALAAAERCLKPGGRLAVVTFHSLEDGIVKSFLRRRAGRIGHGSRHLPPGAAGPEPSFQLINQRGVSPSDAEIAANPRARSARLRAAVRTSAPAWASEAEDDGPHLSVRMS